MYGQVLPDSDRLSKPGAGATFCPIPWLLFQLLTADESSGSAELTIGTATALAHAYSNGTRAARMKVPTLGKLYILAIVLLGALLGATVLSHWQSPNLIRFACYTALALFAARLKSPLPGITGSISVLFVFILFAIVELSLPEALVIGCGATLAQCYWRKLFQPRWEQVLFNVCSMAITVVVASDAYYSPWLQLGHLEAPVKLVVATVAFFGMNTFPVAAAIAVTERKSLRLVWRECYFWAFPYYLAGSILVGIGAVIDHYVGWQTALLAAPAAYLIYRAYFLYIARMEEQKRHAEEAAALHLRTIEALALAIEAKDQVRYDHLQRVEVYAVEIGKELGLRPDQLAGLRAAALLHDIGKLAVPEHIVSKPGKLTREEFEKMKIHPVVGAEILERVRFPYEVTPIVRAHHERWDGSGYPDGLKGENIPIGARILAAADFVDALASDRQYRRALPIEEAIQRMPIRAKLSIPRWSKSSNAATRNWRRWPRPARTPVQFPPPGWPSSSARNRA